MEVRPGYKQTEVGVIPEDWSARRVGDICGFIVPGRNKPRHFDGQIPWVTTPDLEDGRSVGASRIGLCVSRAEAQAIGSRVVPVGSVLMSCAGDLGITAITRNEIVINQQLHAFIPSPQVNAVFLLNVITSQKPQIGGLATKTAVPYLNKNNCNSIHIPLPPVAEQEAIANALSDADALIESVEQLLAKKRQLKQGAMQELLTGKKRLPGFSGEWATRQLGEVILHCSSGATPYRGRPDYYKGTVKWITSGELNYNVIADTIEHISEEAVQQTNLTVHPAGTFLMAITGLEAAGTRGSCGIVGSPATTNQSCMAIYPSPEMKTEYLYQYYVLRGNDLALQYCQGTKQQSYTAKLVKLLPIDLPPTIEEQTAIAAILTDMDAEITALEGKLAKARQIKKGMMQELLTGRIRLV